LRETFQILRPLKDALHGPCRGLRVVRGDVLKDVFKPALGLDSPAYFCHERMRWPMSSFDIVRFASESARPRSTMT
jgi:hypothetical protein